MSSADELIGLLERGAPARAIMKRVRAQVRWHDEDKTQLRGLALLVRAHLALVDRYKTWYGWPLAIWHRWRAGALASEAYQMVIEFGQALACKEISLEEFLGREDQLAIDRALSCSW